MKYTIPLATIQCIRKEHSVKQDMPPRECIGPECFTVVVVFVMVCNYSVIWPILIKATRMHI